MLTISEILQTEKDARRLLASRWFLLEQHILHTGPLIRIGRFNFHVQLQNFVSYRLLNSIQNAEHFDSSSFWSFWNLEVDKLLLLLIITCIQSTNKVVAMIPGSVNVDEMMTRLLRRVDLFKERQRLEIAEEERGERVLREQRWILSAVSPNRSVGYFPP